MKNLHIIPTDKLSRLYLVKDKLKLSPLKFTNDEEVGWLTQNIYITNSEEIKDGEKCITFGSDKCEGQLDTFQSKVSYSRKPRKIILTTDQDLDGVQQIDDDFLEWFVKNPSCENVEVDDYKRGGREVLSYIIIIPKEEPKHIPYTGKVWEPPKQETLEEVAERLLANNIDGLRDALKDDDLFYFYKGVIQSYGEVMAKFQAKKMYSEEEVSEIAKDAYTMGRNNILIGVFNKWFNQVKKKYVLY